MTGALARHCEIFTPLGFETASSRLISPIVAATSPVLNDSRSALADTPLLAAGGAVPSGSGAAAAGPL
eukprot:1534458-Prymnesium_polylepis.1